MEHLDPRVKYQLAVFRTGFHANDAYSAYLEMGSPRQLTTAQLDHLNQLTRDLPEKNESVRPGKDGTLEATIAMRSNDIVLVTLQSRKSSKRKVQ